jgi:tetratricopeptide (TPR) repeat protein
MLRKSTHAVRHRSGSKLAMAFVLAAGLLGTAILEAPAEAQRSGSRQQGAADQSRPDYSREFVAVYQPVADIANTEGGDFASARNQLNQIYAAIRNDDERSAAGNLTLLLGNKLNDQALQRRGLEMMLQSGKVAPEQVGQFQFFIGNLAIAAKDHAAGRAALQAAIQAGYTDGNAHALIAESYFSEGQAVPGLEFLKGVIDQQKAAGQNVPESWMLRGLQVAYTNGLAEQAADFSAMLIANNPTQNNWMQSLQVINALNTFEPQVRLDLLRLMMATDVLTDRAEYIAYIEAADVRVMSNEVLRVLERGTQRGLFNSGDPFYAETKAIADERAPADRREAPSLANEARSAARGNVAQSAGDVYLSLADYAQAEAMYALALEKGQVDRDRNLTRLGIAQALQGKRAEAKATFSQVGGPRASVARMWTAYVDSKA